MNKMINEEDVEIIESSLISIKQISSLLNEMEQFYNNKETNKEGLTKRQASLLIYLLQLPAPPSIRELSRLLSTSHQNVKQICLILEREQLIRFVQDIQDKRKKRIKLTMKGESKANEINKSLHKISSLVSQNFTSKDIDDLARLLRKLQFVIDNENYEIRKKFNN